MFFFFFVCFLMMRRPPRSTLDRASEASDVYKRQLLYAVNETASFYQCVSQLLFYDVSIKRKFHSYNAVSYTHLRAHETVLDLVCRLLLENKHIHSTHRSFSIHSSASLNLPSSIYTLTTYQSRVTYPTHIII